MALFSQEFIQEVIFRNDIVDVIGSVAKLKSAGNSNYKALCPLHNDTKTPSLSISADKQMFHCFGCGKGGTVINFIMEYDGLDFVEAVKYLAEKAGLEIPQEANEDKPLNSDLRHTLYNLNIEAAKFFCTQLHSAKGKKAIEYAKSRHLTDETIKRFRLGYAPGDDSLLQHLSAQGFTAEQLRLAGVTGEGDNGNVYQRFRNRLMFPIIDLRKNVIAFGGRALGDGDPKYLNTSQTPVFSKSHNLFALNFAKKSAEGRLLLVEGYMDVIMLHQHGFDYAVATLGTALTTEQARLIKRYRHEVIISYDADEAGQKAAERAIGLLREAGIEARVLTQNDCKDPDEYINKHGAAAFKELIKNSPPALEYVHDNLKNKYDLQTPNGKIAYTRDFAKELAKITGPAEREIWARRVAEEVGISYESILQEAARASVAKTRQGMQSGNSGGNASQNKLSDIYIGKFSVGEEAHRGQTPEKALLTLMSKDIAAVDIAKRELSANSMMFTDELCGRLATAFFEGKSAKDIAADDRFADDMPEISKIILADNAFENMTNQDIIKGVNELVTKIKQSSRARKLIKAAADGDSQQVSELLCRSEE
ncbi:MAG: DNA primase, partial [Clostridiales bacterium]|nr:DNA primase [Clostridiales bacterium]